MTRSKKLKEEILRLLKQELALMQRKKQLYEEYWHLFSKYQIEE